jgi:hypothetical protein
MPCLSYMITVFVAHELESLCYPVKSSNMYKVFSFIKIIVHLLNNHMNAMNTFDGKCIGLLTESDS